MKRLLCCLLLVLMAAISTAPVYSQGEPPPASNVTIHVVQRGENLTAIAERYGLTVEELARFNGITNPSALVVGQRLLIPLNLPPEAVEPQVHVVQPGETLAGIAALYGLDVQALAAQNAITEINTVYVGQTLTISAGAEPIPQATAEVIASDVRHVIQAGETLFGIATQYGVSMADLQQLNGITNPETIFAGQELLIPGGYVPVTALDLPASLTSVEVRPLTLYTGQTARVRLVAASPVTMTATFLGAAVPVIFEQES
ncbi:MAG: LysM peptidoglycan-binding domain-containing protein [bacterium]|nr:LysM peptidoglycan-binding domain-containing protein [bacterium]